jgi:hypothetical protein
MEHMISDAYSMNIFLRDVFTHYLQTMRGEEISLPKVTMQFADYAVSQKETHESWLAKHGAYWRERLTGFDRLRFPIDIDAPDTTAAGWKAAPLKIGSELKAELLEWCRARQTTLVMSVFTAYVALVLRWCHTPEAVIQYESDGRNCPQAENAIGYFAGKLFLRIRLNDEDSFIDLLKRVTQEYCNAYEHADSSYMESKLPQPEFTRNTVFNWVPQGAETQLSNAEEATDTFTCTPVSFAHPMLRGLDIDAEPLVLLFDGDHEIVGDVYFQAKQFSSDTIARFTRNLSLFVESLLRRSEERVKDVSLI